MTDQEHTTLRERVEQLEREVEVIRQAANAFKLVMDSLPLVVPPPYPPTENT